jgi:peptidoglycan/LPS O-acetylase OafA/YrhL
MAEIRALTGLRGVAALTVACAHMRETLITQGLSLELPQWLVRLVLSGGRQVDIFFVLSGFILTMNYRSWFADAVRRSSYFKFLQRRLARIYPLHFVMLVLIISLVLIANFAGLTTRLGLSRFDFSKLPETFLLVHAWGGIFSSGLGEWNPPSWSISIEALAYLLFPPVLWLTVRPFATRPWIPVIVATAVGVLLNALLPWDVSGVGGIARGLSEFVLGCFAFGLLDGRAAAWLQSGYGSLVAPLLLAVCYLLTPDTGFVIAICTVPLLFTLCGDNPTSRALGCAPVFFLGEISYSIYLGHFLLSSIAYRIVSPSWMATGLWPSIAGMAFTVAFIIGASTVLYHLVEKPGRDFLSGRRRAAGAPVQAS